MVAAVSSLHGTSTNVAAPPVTVENAVKSTSAETTVRMEEPAHRHAQVQTLTDTLCLCGQGSAHLSLELHQEHCFFSSGAPTCRCQTGFTGPKCNLYVCNNYCQNGGNCTVNQGNQPTCRCPKGFLGDQCQYSEFSYLSP